MVSLVHGDRELIAEVVLVGIEPRISPRDRLLAVYRHGDHLVLPLDAERPANAPLIEADRLFLHRAANDWRTERLDVIHREGLGKQTRDWLEDATHTPISSATELLHLVPTSEPAAPLTDFDALVVVLDGSDRAARALPAAIELGRVLDRPLRIAEVRGRFSDRHTQHAIERQAAAVGIAAREIEHWQRAAIERQLAAARPAPAVVTAAFGAWDASGRLFGVLHDIVDADVPTVIGVGPAVPAGWSAQPNAPIVLCVDESPHAHRLADRIGAFISSPQDRVIVLHVAESAATWERAGGTSMAETVARRIRATWGVEAHARTIACDAVAKGIATTAAAVGARLAATDTWRRGGGPRFAATYSWRREVSGRPVRASNSVASVAHSPCPVVVLSEPG